MSTNEKYLLVFNFNTTNNESLDTRIKRYAQLVNHVNTHKKAIPQWHILVVMPKIPSAAMQLPQVAMQAHQQSRHAVKQLSEIGSKLNIPSENLHLRSGLSDLQAWSFAKGNEINKVYGYSRFVTRWMRKCKRWFAIKKTYTKTNLNQHIKSKPWWSNFQIAGLIHRKTP